MSNENVILHHPVVVALPKGSERVTAAHFYADDAPALVERAREMLEVGKGIRRTQRP